MHPEAREYITRTVNGGTFGRVVEFGARNVNGTIRDLILAQQYVGVDLAPGDGVDVVGDAADWTETGFDLVVCCEVLEHTRHARRIIFAARRALTTGGRLLVTCATDPRPPHSAFDGGPLRDGEFYRNVRPDLLAKWVNDAGFASASVEVRDGDLYCQATA